MMSLSPIQNHASPSSKRLVLWRNWKQWDFALSLKNGKQFNMIIMANKYYTPKVNTYTKERAKKVRECLRQLAKENGWKVTHNVGTISDPRPIYEIR